MKKIFTLLALLISFGLSSEITATNNQVVAKSTGCTSINGKGVATFVVTSPQEIILLSESSHQAGKEIYQYSLATRTYIIAVIIEGNINAQKVIVK